MITNKLYRFLSSFYFASRQTFTAAFFRLISIPLKIIIKRDPSLIIVISRPGGSFSDNGKYFYVYASGLIQKEERLVYMTTDLNLQRRILDCGGDSILHPSLESLYLLLKCGKAITDFDWFKFGAFPLTIGAKLIQLWHGAPLKHIELDLFRKRLSGLPSWLHPILKIQKKIIGRYPHYDLVVCTSQWFVEEVFQNCFKSKKILATGYPRNDILFGWPDSNSAAYELAWINVDKNTLKTVKSARIEGKKVCLYVPTFRKDMVDPFYNEIRLATLSEFAQKNDLLFVLKLHPFMQGKYSINQYTSLIEYEALGDVYPIMPHIDLLITDYSSIFFDFLLLDRPIVFFPYDLEQYLSQDRAMYFNYESMTPGPKCRTYDELENQIERIFMDGFQDDYAGMRMKIRNLTHDHMDLKSHQRLISSIRNA